MQQCILKLTAILDRSIQLLYLKADALVPIVVLLCLFLVSVALVFGLTILIVDRAANDHTVYDVKHPTPKNT